MKHIIIYYILAVALGLAACSSDDELAGVGYLVIGEVSLDAGNPVVLGTRAVDADLNVDILDAAGMVVMSLSAGEAAASQKIELPHGDYTLRAYTSNVETVYGGNERGEAKYRGEKVFSVRDGRVTYLSLVVPMVNAAVSLALPEGFDTWFTDYDFTVSMCGRTVSIGNGETAFFDLDADMAVATYTLAATNTDGEEMSSSDTFETQVGKHYTVTVLGF